ncbi:MAG: hypothetical protein IT215_06450 [Chitinophagaceae bacterium]|nr:hypothetical protein [Chitinophagaceae bacterium]
MNTSITSGQLAKFLEILEQKGINPDAFQARLANGILADVFDAEVKFPDRDEWRKILGLGAVINTVTVDYGMTLDEMIRAGKYAYANDNIDDRRFPVKGKGKVEVECKLFQFTNRNVSSEEAMRVIKEAGWEVAKAEHLLAFGVKYPEEQLKYPIIALGSVGKVDGDRDVASLCKDGSKRRLDLYWFDNDWHSYYRFLAVRKVSRT